MEKDLVQFNDLERMNLLSGDYFEIEYLLLDGKGEKFSLENGRKVQII